MRNEEFEEEDIWEVFKERKDSDSKLIIKNNSSFKVKEASNLIPKRLPPSSSRMIIPKYNNKISNFKVEPKTIHHHSAPVNIPDWSKIYGKTYSKNSGNSWLDVDSDDDENDRRPGFTDEDIKDEEEEEEEERNRNNNVIPPHELIARNQISSFSVCEGAGRTLKGRDLSRLNDLYSLYIGRILDVQGHEYIINVEVCDLILSDVVN
ncbi:hypothetical protein ACJIZ3_006957 [Penstemon smallii]|uniref:Uncharacterized protein n=1 Tax=Penstemon smallii TaxID=265156 RepID=A0ABD3S9B3_9LAMI